MSDDAERRQFDKLRAEADRALADHDHEAARAAVARMGRITARSRARALQESVARFEHELDPAAARAASVVLRAIYAALDEGRLDDARSLARKFCAAAGIDPAVFDALLARAGQPLN